jgi:hypothetical protein
MPETNNIINPPPLGREIGIYIFWDELLVGWGRVYIDCLSASNIVSKTRPYKPSSQRASPTIYAWNQQYNKPAQAGAGNQNLHFLG